MSKTLDKVREVIAEVLEVEQGDITIDSTPDTLTTWDSLRHLNIVLALESEIGIQLDPDEIEKIVSVRDIVEVIDAKC